MSLRNLLVHDVTIQRAGSTTNRYGDTVKDWDSATTSRVKGWVYQQSRSEDLDSREAEIGHWILFVESDVALAGEDRIVWEGITFEVDGPPRPAWSPQGLHHKEAELRVVEG